MTIAKLVKQLIDAAAMTQRDVAKRVKTSEQHVSNIVNGHSEPSAGMLLRIVDVTGHTITKK